MNTSRGICFSSAQSANQRHAAASFVDGRPDDSSAEFLISMMGRAPDCRVMLFQRSWSRVDKLRDQVAARGLSDRVAVHHADALDWLPENVRSAVMPTIDADAHAEAMTSASRAARMQ